MIIDNKNKISKEYMINSIKEELIIYLKSGGLRNLSLNNKLDINIDSFEQLLKIHFILHKDTIKYIKNIKEYMHKFNTSIENKEVYKYGQHNSRIVWNKTIEARYNRGNDPMLFVCAESKRKYHSNENIVLKTILEIILNILESQDIEKILKYDWYKECKDFRKHIEKVVNRNIYLSKINFKNIKINKKILNNIKKSRNILYRESAKLLEFYYKIMSQDLKEVNNLMSSTFIEIIKEDTLFELYCAIKIIKNSSNNPKFYILEPGKSKIAEWFDENYKYIIFHNSTGTEEIKFNVEMSEIDNIIDNEYILKLKKISYLTNDIVQNVFSKSINRYNNLYLGRPDILIEVRCLENNNLEKIIIGEAKYTNDIDYAIQGVKELIEYIEFIKYKNNDTYKYITDEIQIKGILFVDNLEIKNTNYENITIVTMNSDDIIKFNINNL